MAVTSQNKEKFEDYEGFVEKFKPKKTTDDCYTPEMVYTAVADWCAKEYSIDKSNFVRPFYPGGDYKSFDYSGKIVVDNPPFSILSQIIRFYIEHNIKFFLFAPNLTSCRYGDFCTVLVVGVDVTYTNGAVVDTSFVTNLEPHEVRARTEPVLYSAVKSANQANLKEQKKQMPKYIYPLELATTAAIYPYSRLGINFCIPRAESVRVSSLDSQKKAGKAVYGSGWLVSERVKMERERAEREKVEREKVEREKVDKWELSKREREIISNLGK